MYKIFQYPSPVLRRKAIPIKGIPTKEQIGVANDMISITKKHDALGLAANQIGIKWSILVIDTMVYPASAFYNPKIIQYSDEKIESVEGCLSIPNYGVKINRSEKILVEAMDGDGLISQYTMIGVSSTVFQHEYDHLRGILIIDYETKRKPL